MVLPIGDAMDRKRTMNKWEQAYYENSYDEEVIEKPPKIKKTITKSFSSKFDSKRKDRRLTIQERRMRKERERLEAL